MKKPEYDLNDWPHLTEKPMKDKIREMLEEIVLKPNTSDPLIIPRTGENIWDYRNRIIDAFADGAEILYGNENPKLGWIVENSPHAHFFAIRLKPQQIEQKVTKSEIVKALRSDTSISDSWDLSNRIERYGVKDGE